MRRRRRAQLLEVVRAREAGDCHGRPRLPRHLRPQGRPASPLRRAPGGRIPRPHRRPRPDRGRMETPRPPVRQPLARLRGRLRSGRTMQGVECIGGAVYSLGERQRVKLCELQRQRGAVERPSMPSLALCVRRAVSRLYSYLGARRRWLPLSKWQASRGARRVVLSGCALP